MKEFKQNNNNAAKTFLAAGAVAAVLAAPMAMVPAEAAESSDAPAEAKTQDLGEVVVTATRTVKRERNVPAATTVITSDDIHASGAQNVAEALETMDGFAYAAYGQNGAAMGTSNNKATIRGIDNGTLVLVNGNPISWRGKYDLSSIPASSIERIEVVKGTGSVLYGSGAMAGVINIITKKGATNEVTAGIGSAGQHHYALNVGDDRLAVTYDFSQWKHGVDVSTMDVTNTRTKTYLGETKTIARDTKKQTAGISYHIDKNLDFLYQYNKTEATFNRQVTIPWLSSTSVGAPYNSRNYTTDQHITQLNYRGKLWKGSFYFNTGTSEYKNQSYFNSTTGAASSSWSHTREKNVSYGLDAQRRWKLAPMDTLIAGVSMQREQFHSLYTDASSNARKYSRNNWAVFTSYEHGFDAKNSMTIGARETWTSGALLDRNYNNFSASGQWLHKMDAENSLYASIAQSFIMPTFAQMYGTGSSFYEANPDLSPQKGVNYEIGWKANHGAHTWKAALFHMDIRDNISASKVSRNSDKYKYTNEDFRNTGLELSWDIHDATPLSYHWGVTWQNPESKTQGSTKNYWDRKFGRIQLTGGVCYHEGKWSSDLSASFLGARVQTPSSEHSSDTKPYLLTKWNTIYAPDEHSELSLAITNVLDRHDIISHTGVTYYNAPISYLFNYTYKF